jgi:Protein of unknown function (DUF3800)
VESYAEKLSVESEPDRHNIARSRMGRYIPHVLLSGKETIVAIRAYLDRSGTKQAHYLTLAAFAGPDLAWAEFEQGWETILAGWSRPLPYFHVVEALHCKYKTPFCRTLGWERLYGWELLGKLIEYMGNFSHGKLTMHSCVIDMNAWRELTAQGCKIPSEVELCNHYVAKYIVAMFTAQVLKRVPSWGEFNIPTEDLLNFTFDRNEDFFDPFRQFVNAQKEMRLGNMWDLVDGVGEGEMRTTPGIQAADILAWSINRENLVNEGDEGKHTAYLLRQIVMSTSKEYDRATLLREFGR